MQTIYLGAIEVQDGFAGDTAVIYLVFDPASGTILAVHHHGYFTYC